MRSISLSLGFAATMVLLCSAPAHSQATRTWVSGVGDDVNPCSRTAPCKTFAGAISKTAINGEINCLDPGGFGAVTITKSITIDCHAEFGSILNVGTNGVIIAFDSFTAADTRRTVRLRNLALNGATSGLNGIRIIGGTVNAGGVVFIEDCVIDGNFAGTARGISDERVGGGELHVSDTTIRNTNTGIRIFPASGAGQRLDALLDNVRIQNTTIGGDFGNNARAVIYRSAFSGNSTAAISAGVTAGVVGVSISNTVISGNNVAVQVTTGSVALRLADNDIVFNTTALSGTTQSYGNNRMEGNSSLGTAPTLINMR